MGANDPQGVASMDPRGLIGRIHVGNHLTSLHTCLLALSLVASETYDPQWRGQFGPQVLDWQDLCRGPLTMLHAKYISRGPHGFREDFSF